MLIRLVSLLLLIAVFCPQVSARITLMERGLFSWEYAKDTAPFVKVGLQGGSLATAMAGDTSAVALMSKFRQLRIAARVAEISGCFGVGWSIGCGLTSDKGWESDHKKGMVIGISLLSLGLLLEISAESTIERAVNLYNSNTLGKGFTLDIRPSTTDQSVTCLIGLKYSF